MRDLIHIRLTPIFFKSKKQRNRYSVVYSNLYVNIICYYKQTSNFVFIPPYTALTAQQSISLPVFGPHDEVTSTSSPPDRNVSLGSCTWIIDHKCPDVDNIKVYLFTRRNPNDRQLIYVSDTWEKSNLSISHFDPSDPVKIIIHGYNSDMYLTPLIDMKDGTYAVNGKTKTIHYFPLLLYIEYLQRGSYNLFYIDWSSLAPGPCYISAVHNARHSGICIGQLVKRILESGTDDIHLIGFSLGAHVTNFVANSVKPFVIPRITGKGERDSERERVVIYTKLHTLKVLIQLCHYS